MTASRFAGMAERRLPVLRILAIRGPPPSRRAINLTLTTRNLAGTFDVMVVA
jgi:hypothetical protein